MMNDPFYLHTDIAPGLTIDEYRRSRRREPGLLRRAVAIASRSPSGGEKSDRRTGSASAPRRLGNLP